MRTHLFFRDAAVVYDKHAVRALLAADGALVETDWPPATRALMGAHSMLFATGKAHARQRRVLGQAFTAAAVASYGGVVESAVRASFAAWAAAGRVRAAVAGKDLAFDVAARALVAPTMDAATAAAFRADFDALVLGMMTLPVDAPGTTFRRSLRARARLLTRIDALIDAELAAGPAPPGAARNALQLMLAAEDGDGDGGRVDRATLRDQVLTQLLAGHETTATTLTRVLTLLADHPDVLAALRAEQAAVQAAHGDAVTAPAAAAAMPLADAVVKEAMRVHPVVQGVFRRAVVDIDVAGVRTPAGWRVVLQVGTTAADVDAWQQDSADFRPQRWLETAADGSPTLVKDPVGYNPWGLGPHICLGAALAQAELRAIVATLARDYEWALADPGEVWTPPLPPARGRPVWFWRRGEAPPAGMTAGVTEEGAAADVPAFLF